MGGGEERGTVKCQTVQGLGVSVSHNLWFSRDKKSSSFQEHMKEFHSIPVHENLFMFYPVPFQNPLPIFNFLLQCLIQIFVLKIAGSRFNWKVNATEKIMKVMSGRETASYMEINFYETMVNRGNYIVLLRVTQVTLQRQIS